MSCPDSACMAQGCSSTSAAAASTSSAITELEELALDPTLDMCCRRDVEQQIKTERIRQALKQDDRTEVRQRMAAAAIRREAAGPPVAPPAQVDSRASALQQPHSQHEHHSQLQQQQQQQHNQQQQQQESKFGDEGELLRLRQQRLRQLQAQSAAKQDQQREGYGTLNTVPEGSVMKLCCQDPPGRGLVVLHMAVQGYEPCNTLDEILEQAAATYRGTYFARAVVSRGSPLVSQLQLPHGVPALLVAKHCALLGKAHIQQFGGADIWEEEVMSYLQRFKVLSRGGSSSLSTPQLAAAARQSGSSEEDSAAESDDDEQGTDWQTPCEVCGRTYPHEHIRSIYSTQHDGSEEDED